MNPFRQAYFSKKMTASASGLVTESVLKPCFENSMSISGHFGPQPPKGPSRKNLPDVSVKTLSMPFVTTHKTLSNGRSVALFLTIPLATRLPSQAEITKRRKKIRADFTDCKSLIFNELCTFF